MRRLKAVLPKVTEQMCDEGKTPNSSLNYCTALPVPGPGLKLPLRLRCDERWGSDASIFVGGGEMLRTLSFLPSLH